MYSGTGAPSCCCQKSVEKQLQQLLGSSKIPTRFARTPKPQPCDPGKPGFSGGAKGTWVVSNRWAMYTAAPSRFTSGGKTGQAAPVLLQQLILTVVNLWESCEQDLSANTLSPSLSLSNWHMWLSLFIILKC